MEEQVQPETDEIVSDEEQPEIEDQQSEEEQEAVQQTKSQNAKQRLRRKLRESEERNRLLDEKLSGLEEKVNGLANPPPARPQRPDFETEEEYEDAVYDWRTEKPAQKPVKEESMQPQAQVPETVARNWRKQVELGIDKYDDFEEVAFNAPITESVADIVAESKTAADIAYFLGENPEEAERISRMSLAMQVREIDKIGEKFSKPVTKTPEPISPVKGTDTGILDLEKMSPEQYRDYRRKQMAG